MSTSPSRRAKRALMRHVQRDAKKRTRNVAKLETWVRRNPTHPLVVKLRAMRAGLEIPGGKEMTEQPQAPTERRTKSGVILPPGVRG